MVRAQSATSKAVDLATLARGSPKLPKPWAEAKPDVRPRDTVCPAFDGSDSVLASHCVAVVRLCGNAAASRGKWSATLCSELGR